MDSLPLHAFHERLGARFTSLQAAEAVADYGEADAEYAALHASAGLLDLSFRGRLCLTGQDRIRFLHGQVTNDVQGLRPGEGCYAAITNAKARTQGDLNIYRLEEELLLDFEPGLLQTLTERLEKYIIADDVQIVDVAPHYGLLTVQGPRAVEGVSNLGTTPPARPFAFSKLDNPEFGEAYLVNRPRCGAAGYELFVPVGSLEAAASKLLTALKGLGGRVCGWNALEMARIEAGIPRFGLDIDDTIIPLEAGLENSAISFKKGCYIGQEIISRIRTYGQVAKALRRLVLAPGLKRLPVKGDKLVHDGKEAGYITSALESPRLKQIIALGYVRKESNAVGTELMLRNAEGESPARVAGLPFQPFDPK